MNSYSPYPYDAGQRIQQMQQQRSPMEDHPSANGIMAMDQDTIDHAGSGQSLQDIVSNNMNAIRRQSVPHPYGSRHNSMDAHTQMRNPLSMIEFNGASPAGPLASFQFEPDSVNANGMVEGPPQDTDRRNQQPRPSQGDLSLDTQFGNSSAFANLMNHNSAYQSPAHQNTGMDLSMNSPFMDTGMEVNMDFGADPGMEMSNTMGGDMSAMNDIFSQAQYSNSIMNSPIHQTATPATHARMQDPGGGGTAQYGNSTATVGRQFNGQNSMPMQDSNPHHPGLQHSRNHLNQLSQRSPSPDSPRGFSAQAQQPQLGSSQDRPLSNSQGRNKDGMMQQLQQNSANYSPDVRNLVDAREGYGPITMTGRPNMQSTYKNAYSSTGFDMLGVLMRVATRPNPEINIGSVDLSCAFVVCDAEKDDIPIVYCSENFERLTGYTKHMILGRNCRFLQSPDGVVEPGVRRKYVDDESVLYLKNMVNARRESQISLINYRRGGQPFMNLLTVIPIAWETEEVKYYVGFQVDLVEQPNAVTNKNPDGSYSINYQRGMAMPRYVMNAPELSNKAELGQTVPRDDVSAILSTIGTGESEYAKRMWDKVLLENTDDVVHVLSLKGLFQWVSPSALRVLEYEPSEIIGTALSSVCHPSDIVPVTRELKDTSSGASVNVVFRIRRKKSGYMWFEGHGSLHTEQGKGRKSIIMVGRERPVYALSTSEILNAGGIGENELWTKISTSGMFLFVSSNVRQLLDRQPDELVGVSIQSLMRSESKTDFGRILEHARTGKKASVKHEMINRRGQVLSAFTTLYPGDATEGLKPTFIVAQTRLIKFSRGNQGTRSNVYSKAELSSYDSSPSNAHFAPQSSNAGDETPTSAGSTTRYMPTDSAPITTSGLNGLVIGHQDASLASDDNLFDELKTTKSSSWQYEIRQLEKRNRILAEEVQSLIAAKKKRKRRKGAGNQQRDCANCHTKVTPEWRRGPSGQRDLCNSCGLRWAKLNGRVSPRTSSQHSVYSAQSDRASKASASPLIATTLAKATPATKTDSAPAYQQPTSNAATPGTEPRETLKFSKPPEGHAASMEGASGVPAKIDEGVEPD